MYVYLDNAATTPLDPLVMQKMNEVMEIFGNPSSIHAAGRKAKAELELARRSIANHLNCQSNEIIFTGSGTEADNMALRCAVRDLGVQHIITSPIEHKAVLDTANGLEMEGRVKTHWVQVTQEGRADLQHLEQLASEYPGALISLMHANNELGTLNDLHAISRIARANQCYFHSDTVQSMGHLALNLQQLDVDFLACSAHKIHGPKGVGFLYKKNTVKIRSMITGGGQESQMRAGTENMIGIAALAKAFELAHLNQENDMHHIQGLKRDLKNALSDRIPGVSFNGDTSEDGSLYTILNVSMPEVADPTAILFQLDMEGICISGGSACNSGAQKGSHVLEGIGHSEDRAAIRFSFSKFTSQSDLDKAVHAMMKILNLVEQS